MIRFRLKELIAEKEFTEERRVTLGEVATATEIARSTISRIANTKGCNVSTDNLDKLCAFFKVDLGALAEYIPDEEL